jgi:hypothetical protein
MARRGPVRGPSHLCKGCNERYRRHSSVASVQLARTMHGAVVLIIRRSWVRAPPAPRRGHEPAPAQTPQPQSTLQWWQELEANIEAVDRALARQQQAAIDVGQSWSPVRHSAVQPEAERSPQLENSVPGQPEIAEPEPDSYGERAARLDELQERADDAAARVKAQRAELDASGEYTARMEREAPAEPEADWQAEALEEVEMELQ